MRQLLHFNRGRTCLLLALMALVALLVPPAQAQTNNAITITVQAGFDQAYHVGQWFPLRVDLANNGPDVRGTVRWTFPSQLDESTFAYSIDLPRGAQKRISMAVFANGYLRNGRISVFNEGNAQPVAQQDVLIQPLDQTTFLTAVASSDPTVLSSLATMQVPDFSSTRVQHIPLDILPDQATVLQSVDALFLHNTDLSTLGAGHIDALRAWVASGGVLVVSGGIDAARQTATLADLLPAQIGTDIVPGTLQPLGAIVGANTVGPGDAVSLNTVTLQPGAQPLPASGSPLVIRQELGAGQVLLTTFDLAALRTWRDEATLWQTVIGAAKQSRPLVSPDVATSSGNILQTVIKSTNLMIPPVWALIAFLLAYILVVGPLNYVLLRRFGRLEWAWGTVPLAVVLFAGLFYLVGLQVRGNDSQIAQVSVIEGAENQDRGQATVFVGLFSPQRRTYNLGFPAQSLVNETAPWSGSSFDQSVIVVDDAAVQIPNIALDIGEARTFVAKHQVDMPFAVRSALTVGPNGVGGTLQNTGNQPLVDALIVRGQSYQMLGTIAPGQETPIKIDSIDNNYPWSVSLPQDDQFNRETLLTQTAANNTTVTNDQNVYLIVWSNDAAIPLLLDNQPATQQALGMYVIRLNT